MKGIFKTVSSFFKSESQDKPSPSFEPSVIEPPKVKVGVKEKDPADVEYGPQERRWVRPKPQDHLTRHFRYREMIHSNTAKRLGIDNIPPKKHVDNFRRLLQNVMEPVRTHFGKPVIVTSGYRSLKLNRAIGSHDNSQHTVGEAIDFQVSNESLSNVYEWVVVESGLPYDQIIYEFGESGWIHVSHVQDRKNRNENLSAYKNQNGQTEYAAWGKTQVQNQEYLKHYTN
jgi:hypothetical protein